MSVAAVLDPPVVGDARSPGPPKLSSAELHCAQAATLAEPPIGRDPVPAVLVAAVDLIYGRRRSLAKFKVLERLAPVPYQAWERAAYRALTRLQRHTGLARRVFDCILEARAQQDNEAWHLLILQDLLQAQDVKRDFLRQRLLARVIRAPYRLLCWILFLVRPAWSYGLNAHFEDHAEREYMAFVAEHPEFEAQPFSNSLAADYGSYDSVADVLRQIGHDERVHKQESRCAQQRAQCCSG